MKSCKIRACALLFMQNISWKHHLKTKHPCYIYSCFILINSVSEAVFHSKVYSVWKKFAFLKNTVAILKKWKKNYGQQSICKAYTIIMFVWNFHACIIICTICPNFQTNISHYDAYGTNQLEARLLDSDFCQRIA